MGKTDRQRLREAFAELRKRGWYARMNYWCCQSCGCAAAANALEEKGIDPDGANVIFWHNQDDDAFCYEQRWFRGGPKDKDLHGTLHMTHQGNSAEAVRVLTQHGLNVHWDGDMGKRIEVHPKEEEGRDAA